ncbi:hypothetical protein GQ53DRAFT_216107 [Thozetella sp. PMI_491]|nr:hypothetical protein GQ53DRAFT_216107 [Thozetella sp. PMI_491]
MSMSRVVLPAGAGAFYGPLDPAELLANQPPLGHPLWGLESVPPQHALPLSPPRSRPHSTSNGSEPAQTPRSYLPRQGPGMPVMDGFDDDMPVSDPAAMAGLYLDPGAPTPRSVKRPRPVKSCLECRKRKLRCDRVLPCLQCQKSHRVCKYAPDGQGGAGSDGESDGETDRASKRLQGNGALHETAMRPPGPFNGAYTGAAGMMAGSPGMDDMTARLDRLEKLLTEKRSSTDHGSPASTRNSVHQPRAPTTPATIRSLSVKGDLRTRLFGQNSSKVLLNLFDEAKEFMRTLRHTEGFAELFVGLQNVHSALQVEHRRDMEPTRVLIDSTTPLQKRMADMLPGKHSCDRLLDSYLTFGEGFSRIVHVPTFRNEYEQYWADGMCNDTFLPRLLCMLAIASKYEIGSRIPTAELPDGVHAPTVWTIVRGWLDGLRGKQRVDLNTLQTELLLLHTQWTIMPRDQDAWTQLGSVVRMAMTMGLHRDPSEFPQLSVFSGEIRRRLWFAIMDMDLQVALLCNLPCAARDDEYSCAPPRNLDDSQLTPAMKELPDAEPMDQSTTYQMQAFLASTLPFRMNAVALISRLDSVRDYGEVLEVGGRLERMLDDINCLFPRQYSPDPQQRYRDWRLRFTLDFHVRRALLALYRPFALSTANCPPQISTAYLKSSMAVLKYLDELDPQVPFYADISHRFLLLLRQDILQAAFSLCYFIKSAADSVAARGRQNGQWPPAMSPGLSESSTPLSAEPRLTWSTPVLVKTVDHALDLLISMAQDTTGDVREIIVLTIVLNSVQGSNMEQKKEKIKNGSRRILDGLIQTLNAKIASDGRAAQTPVCSPQVSPGCSASPKLTHWQSTPVVPVHLTAQQLVQVSSADVFATTAPMNYITEDFFQANMPDDFPVWDNFLDYWNPADMSMDAV